MIHLTYCIQRRPDLSAVEFERRLEDHHAVVADAAQKLRVAGFEVKRPVSTAWNTCVSQPRGLKRFEPDAIVELRWNTLADYEFAAGSPDGIAATDLMIESERRFVDFAKSSASFVASPITKPSFRVKQPAET